MDTHLRFFDKFIQLWSPYSELFHNSFYLLTELTPIHKSCTFLFFPSFPTLSHLTTNILIKTR